MSKNEEVKDGIIFLRGKKLDEETAKLFIGQAYLEDLVSDAEIEPAVGNVTFEPGARNNWHIHRDGYQILLVTGGEGWYQVEGEKAQFLTPGDVIVTHDGVKHWHGATKDSWFSHLSISAGTAEWLEAVEDDVYDQLDKE